MPAAPVLQFRPGVHCGIARHCPLHRQGIAGFRFRSRLPARLVPAPCINQGLASRILGSIARGPVGGQLGGTHARQINRHG